MLVFSLAVTMSTAVLAAGGIGVSRLDRPVSQVPPAPDVSPFRVVAGVPVTEDPTQDVPAPVVAPPEDRSGRTEAFASRDAQADTPSRRPVDVRRVETPAQPPRPAPLPVPRPAPTGERPGTTPSAPDSDGPRGGSDQGPTVSPDADPGEADSRRPGPGRAVAAGHEGDDDERGQDRDDDAKGGKRGKPRGGDDSDADDRDVRSQTSRGDRGDGQDRDSD